MNYAGIQVDRSIHINEPTRQRNKDNRWAHTHIGSPLAGQSDTMKAETIA